MDVDLAFLPPASLLHSVATPVVALACPGPQVVPADPPTLSAGPRQLATALVPVACWSLLVPAGALPWLVMRAGVLIA
ncbi:unnamed protein product [Boreogadus saida]